MMNRLRAKRLVCLVDRIRRMDDFAGCRYLYGWADAIHTRVREKMVRAPACG